MTAIAWPKSWPARDQTDCARPDIGQQRSGRMLVEIGAFDHTLTSLTEDLHSQCLLIICTTVLLALLVVLLISWEGGIAILQGNTLQELLVLFSKASSEFTQQ